MKCMFFHLFSHSFQYLHYLCTKTNMKHLFSLLLLLMSCAIITAQSIGTYRNPIIPGFHPDPSIVRVGEDFYLVNSSFQYFPGVPIFHSRDLIHWEQIGNVLDRKSQLPLSNASSWLGIYAPTIRYNNGTYYMITTNVGNGGNFLVTAKDPKGPWSEPKWLAQQGIDPSLLFEGDSCWMVSNPDGHITLCRIDPATGKQLSPSTPIWDGTGGRYPEGPHLYKKDGYYYLLISEGGTELAHHLTIARSRNIYGPYEADPANPILTNCNHKGESKQIQGCGHGDFVQDANGNWWVVFLAYRNYEGSYHHLGRETCLAPVSWKEGEWPVVYNGNAIDTVMHALTLPSIAVKPSTSYYDFKENVFAPEWIHLGQPDDHDYEFTNKGLRLYGSATTSDGTAPSTWVGLRQTSATCSYETEIDCTGLKGNDVAGIDLFQINDVHFQLAVTPSGNGCKAMLRIKLKAIDYIAKSIELKSGTVKLRITSDGKMYQFACMDNGKWQNLGAFNCSLLSTEVAGGFTGVTVGLFCNGKGYADFHWLKL